jgi:site-specific DNA-cytosine methylase
MKMLELFAGTRRMADTFEKHGFETYTIEIDQSFPRIDWYQDILKIGALAIVERFGYPDVIWASPVCTSFSVAAISTHRRKEPNGNLAPITDKARHGDAMVKWTLSLISDLQPKYFFIENPMGALRKMEFMQGIPRHLITYCQYGEAYQKPTDIWTNHPDPKFKPPCKRGMPCHESAPRGSATGVQRLKNSREKAKLPLELCEHIAKISLE